MDILGHGLGLATILDGGQNPRIPLGADRSLITSSGIYCDFETGETWTQNEATVAVDAVNYTHGTQGLKLTSVNASRASADHTITTPLPLNAIYVLDIFMDDVTKLGRFQLFLTGNNFVTYLVIDDNGTPWTGWVNGWNKLVFTTESFGGTGTVAGDWATENKLRIAVKSKAGATVNMTVDNLRWYFFRPALTFTFDDGRVGNHDYAMPLFKKYGFAATCYLATDAVGQATYTPVGGGEFSPMTLAQLQALQANGWDIANHTMTHVDLRTLDLAGQTAEIQGAYNYLVANGFTKAPQFFATPYGFDDANTPAALLAAGEVNSRADTAADVKMYDTPYLSRPNPGGYAVMIRDTWHLAAQSLSSADGTSLATFQGWVQRAIQFGYWCIILGHDVGPSGYVSAGLMQSYLGYMQSVRGQIDVLTMSEYWSRRATILSLL